MLKKIMVLGCSLLLITLSLSGCGSPQTDEAPSTSEDLVEGVTEKQADTETQSEVSVEEGNYEDGFYYAKEDAFSENSGWKYYVILEVQGGKVVDINWNGVHKTAGLDKYTTSENGDYGLVAKGGATDEWHVQADRATAYLLELQDPTMVDFVDEDGHIDAVSGVTINVKALFSLAEAALEQGPVEMGPYKDGAYYAEEDAFSENSGWKSTVNLAVVFGNIEAVHWNGLNKDGGDDKRTASMNGDYPMVANGGAQSEWHVQAALVEAHLLESQDPTAITYQEDSYHTDAISSVSIGVSPFFKLAEKALDGAMK